MEEVSTFWHIHYLSVYFEVVIDGQDPRRLRAHIRLLGLQVLGHEALPGSGQAPQDDDDLGRPDIAAGRLQ